MSNQKPFTERHLMTLALACIAQGQPQDETSLTIIHDSISGLQADLGFNRFAELMDWMVARKFTEDELRAMILPGHEGKELREAAAAVLNEPRSASQAIANLLHRLTGARVAVLRDGDPLVTTAGYGANNVDPGTGAQTS